MGDEPLHQKGRQSCEAPASRPDNDSRAVPEAESQGFSPWVLALTEEGIPGSPRVLFQKQPPRRLIPKPLSRPELGLLGTGQHLPSTAVGRAWGSGGAWWAGAWWGGAWWGPGGRDLGQGGGWWGGAWCSVGGRAALPAMGKSGLLMSKAKCVFPQGLEMPLLSEVRTICLPCFL